MAGARRIGAGLAVQLVPHPISGAGVGGGAAGGVVAPREAVPGEERRGGIAGSVTCCDVDDVDDVT